MNFRQRSRSGEYSRLENRPFPVGESGSKQNFCSDALCRDKGAVRQKNKQTKGTGRGGGVLVKVVKEGSLKR